MKDTIRFAPKKAAGAPILALALALLSSNLLSGEVVDPFSLPPDLQAEFEKRKEELVSITLPLMPADQKAFFARFQVLKDEQKAALERYRSGNRIAEAEVREKSRALETEFANAAACAKNWIGECEEVELRTDLKGKKSYSVAITPILPIYNRKRAYRIFDQNAAALLKSLNRNDVLRYSVRAPKDKEGWPEIEQIEIIKGRGEAALRANANKPVELESLTAKSTDQGTQNPTTGRPKPPSSNQVKSWLNMANQYIKTYNLEKAKEYARRIISEAPESPEADEAKSILAIEGGK